MSAGDVCWPDAGDEPAYGQLATDGCPIHEIPRWCPSAYPPADRTLSPQPATALPALPRRFGESPTETIREAKMDDLDVIVDFNTRIAEQTRERNLPSLSTLRMGVGAILSDPSRGRYLLACDGDHVLGQLLSQTMWNDWLGGEEWWVENVYTATAHRGRGVYRALFEHAKRMAQASPHAVLIRLVVAEQNLEGQKAHERLGMHRAGLLMESLTLKSDH
jgi:ribosomal protein S18 acetylase RimI-like enzyme